MPYSLSSRFVVFLTLLGALFTLASWLRPPARLALFAVAGILAIQAFPVYLIYQLSLSRHRRQILESIAAVGGRVTARLAVDPRSVLGVDLSHTNLAELKWESLRGLSHLETLSLAHTAVTDDHLETLSQMLPKLRDLDLAHTAVTDAGLLWLRDFPCLNAVSLSGTRITGEGLEMLFHARPELHVEARDLLNDQISTPHDF